MTANGPKELTVLLSAARHGDAGAARELLPRVYTELRRLAAHQMAGRPGTLQATALVHEAYLRLVGEGDLPWPDRRQFFAAAAVAMRDILVERARRNRRVKHGGGRRRALLADAADVSVPGEPDALDLVALDEALRRLAARHPRRGEVVLLRYFAGLSVEDTALALAVSPATVKREWTLARAALYEELAEG